MRNQYYFVTYHYPAHFAAPQTDMPEKADERFRVKRELNCLRQQLEEAVEAEDYERAAHLRDEIHRLERSDTDATGR